MPDLAVIYSTFGSVESARQVASALVEERLLACANLLPGGISVYRWEGTLHADPEIVLIGKTRSDLVASAIERLRTLHPYEVPCITSWPIAASSESYGAWIEQATAFADPQTGPLPPPLASDGNGNRPLSSGTGSQGMNVWTQR